MLSAQEFTRQLINVKDQYRDDNGWVASWSGWNNEERMTEYIQFAYNLYNATAHNRLQLTLLGGTGIRKNEPYIRSFGITGANGIQEEITRKYVQREVYKRHARTAIPNPAAQNPDRDPVRVRGGSILSEKGWTPILNDALILGAITARQQFAVAFTVQEQSDWDRMNAGKINKTAATADRFQATPKLINAWKEFLNAQKQMFFNGNTPRVFARELLGLKFFGYKPDFTWHQLAFQAKPDNIITRPDFQTYLRKLREVRFEARDRALVMQEISGFLFNDPNALGANWT